MIDKILDLLRCPCRSNSKFAGKKVLVVDDGEVEREFISRVLEKRGFVARTAADGHRGLDMAVNGEKFDLVVLDYYMPGFTGKEVCAGLKRNEKTKDIPVIFLTGSANARDVVECFDAGAEYFLRKPISGAMLIKQIEMILSELEKAPAA
jgi:two-component system, OmpR family, response regulator RpaA